MPRRLTGLLELSSWSRPRIWIVGFLAFFALSAAWALATPLTAVPDEPAHIVKAAATVRGQLDGPPIAVNTEVGGIPTQETLTGYRVPAQYAQLLDMHDCYFVHPQITANCAEPLSGGSGTAIVGTSAGGNNPAYYFVVGWPSLISHGEPGIYAMRLFSTAIGGALLASAVVTLAEWKRRRGVLLLGLAAAATPTSLFLNGSVNPNGIEVCSAILVWCSLLALLVDPRPELVARRLTRAAIGSAVLVEVRPLGPLWILGIVLCALLVGEPGTLRPLLRRRATWVGTGVVSTATLAAFAWSVHSNVLITAAVNYPQFTFLKAAHYTFNHSGLYMDSMIGLFGWLDVTPPTGARFLWKMLLLLLALLAFFAGRKREKFAVVALIFSIIAIPVLAQAKQAAHLGYIWQGRYLLAVAVGLPLLCTTVLAKRPVTDKTRPFAVQRWMLAVAGLFLLDGFVIFYGVLQRYAMGSKGPLFSLDPAWTPPGGIMLAILLFLAGTALLGWLILVGTPLNGAARPEARDSEAGEPAAGRDDDARILAQIGDSLAPER